ncbi:hypothetical protein [Pedobacter zeae]|uniref:Uncharacterized protein n=1 Tax=Pedobacter zeae TaxID=1737356 RepID=A0A7W6K9S5_9SPHI|nr:hypothetical protein [Pedobacter zeae]MBB4107727.1 hypothetical protein [Pedobacter zeae]GGG97461.1 hypothetical protein GCM10007422_09270 [Pedobacter zeae]
MAEETFRVKSGNGDDLIVPIEEYKKLRNKIRARLQQFYKECEYKDAGIDDEDILFFCTIYSKQIIKKFNVAEWLDAERSGKFNEKYYEFTKSGKKSSVGISAIAGKGDGKFRKKKYN